MLGYLGYRAARGQWNLYQKSRKQKGGPWTLTAVMFLALPFTVLEMLVKLAQESPWFWAWLPGNLILALIAVASSGLFARRKFESKVVTVYARREADLTSAAAMRTRVAQLSRTQPDLAPARTQPDLPEVPDDDDNGPEDLFLGSCPACPSPAGVPCRREAGNTAPMVLVREQPLAFCHFERIAASVRAGHVPLADLAARFGGQLPEPLAGMLKGT
jgi:hypothetical protein